MKYTLLRIKRYSRDACDCHTHDIELKYSSVLDASCGHFPSPPEGSLRGTEDGVLTLHGMSTQVMITRHRIEGPSNGAQRETWLDNYEDPKRDWEAMSKSKRAASMHTVWRRGREETRTSHSLAIACPQSPMTSHAPPQ